MANQNGSVGSVSQSSESQAAYEALLPRIVQASKGEVPPLNTDVVQATQAMLTSSINARAFRTELERIGCAAALELEPRALALSYANALFKWSQDELMPLSDSASSLALVRKELVAALNLLALRGVLDAGTVKIQNTTGYLAMADDVRAIATALLARWAEVGSHIGGDRGRVEQALVAADKLTRAVAESEALKEKAQTAAAMRGGAWALALAAYREMQRAIGFLRFYEEDVDAIVPAIFNHGGGRPAKTSEPANAAPAASPSPSPAPVNGSANLPATPMAPSQPFEQ